MSSELIILTLVVIIIIILSRDWAPAIIIILLLLNLIAASKTKNWLEIIPDFTKGNSDKPAHNSPHIVTNTNIIADTKSNVPAAKTVHKYPLGYNPALDIYGQYYEQWNAVRREYTDCYADPRPNVLTSCGEKGLNTDAANTIMAQKRARDKRCSDGWAVKDKYYYAYGFADELDLEEKKRWWGNEEW